MPTSTLVTLVIATLGLLALPACGQIGEEPGDTASGEEAEICDNEEDDDLDGQTDCEDDDCTGDPACP